MGTSPALTAWQQHRAMELDRTESVHRAITGGRAGRRWDCEHLNCAIITRLSSEFQGHARDLLDDAVEHVVDQLTTDRPGILLLTRGAYLKDAGLSTGNPTWNVLASDFGRVGLDLRLSLDARYPTRGPRWRASLQAVLYARNAIAHADDVKLARCRAQHDLTLLRAQQWRSSLDGLATGLDRVVGAHLKRLTNVDPW